MAQETQVNVSEGSGVARTASVDTFHAKNALQVSLGGKYYPHTGVFIPVGLNEAQLPRTVNTQWVNLSELTKEAQQTVAVWVYNLYDLAEGVTVANFKSDFSDLATIYFANK